jgi:asparagine synthetase B (glutamine-hydrolysing)
MTIKDIAPFIRICRRPGSDPLVTGKRQARFGTAVNSTLKRGGIFGNWSWENNLLTAEVDPYGVFHLFYCESDDGIMLSSSPLQLISIGASREINRTALACFHLLGWYINEDTVFKHIKVLLRTGICDGMMAS